MKLSFAKNKFEMKSILFLIVLLTIVLTAKACLKDADCLHTECCSRNPTGNNTCMEYLDAGKTCPLRQTNRVILTLKKFQ